MGTEGGWAGTALCYNLNLLSARPKNQQASYMRGSAVKPHSAFAAALREQSS